MQLGTLKGRCLASPLRCSLLYISGQDGTYLTRQLRKDNFSAYPPTAQPMRSGHSSANEKQPHPSQ